MWSAVLPFLPQIIPAKPQKIPARNGVGSQLGQAGTQALTGLLSSLTGKITSNIMDVISFGDLTCWGSSYNPKKAQNDITLDFPKMIEVSGIENNINDKSINMFSMMIDTYIADAKNGMSPRFAKCTQKGHKVRFEKSKQFREQILEVVKQTHNLTPLRVEQGKGSIHYPGYAHGRNFNFYSNSYQKYRVTAKNPVINAVTATANGVKKLGGGSILGLAFAGIIISKILKSK